MVSTRGDWHAMAAAKYNDRVPATSNRWKSVCVYAGYIFGSLVVSVVAIEIYLAHQNAPRPPIPFYNHLYPYVMFRPNESYVYETTETYEMSHHKSRVLVYSNEDGFRVPLPNYRLPKQKPAGQLRIAFLGSSSVQLASTFELTLPGSFKKVLQSRYPGRDIEVINAGIQSCTARQSLVQLVTTVVDYQPNIVVLYDGMNDLGLPMTYESRPNFPYNFQNMEEAWDLYRREHREPLWKIALERSFLYRGLRARFERGSKLTPRADAPAVSNVVPASRILSDNGFVVEHVAAYLSNWRKLIELARVYDYQPVCILNAVGQLDADHSANGLMNSFHLSRETAFEWIRAFNVLYDVAGREIEGMVPRYPQVVMLNMSRLLPTTSFWDLAHVYDEVNAVLAEDIYQATKLAIERRLQMLQAGAAER